MSGQLGIQIPAQATIDESVELASFADELGFESVWVGEAWGREPFVLLAHLASLTRRIKLGLGIINVFGRSAATIGQSICTLDELSKGRAILGLGSSSARVVEGWHGVPFRSPLRRTREYIEILRQIVAYDRVDHDGEIVKVRGFRLQFRPYRSALPIYLAAVSARNLELTGEMADGWLPIFLSPHTFSEMRSQIERARDARVDRVARSYAPYVLTSLVADDRQARTLVQRHISHYIGRMGDYYAQLISRQGFEAEVARIREAWSRGDAEEASRLIDERMLSELAVVGSADRIRQGIEQLWSLGATMPILTFPARADIASMRRTMAAAAGTLLGVRA